MSSEFRLDTVAEPQEDTSPALSGEDVGLLEKLKSSERLKELLTDDRLKSKLDEVLKTRGDSSFKTFKQRENEIRRQGQKGSGFMPVEETFLKDYILECPQFKEVIQILNDIIQ
ncbi:hypothetical protein HDE_13259 [Halotydeus destructor]|nr:hypothetical protein HDE_13259 [Halotydeus destructor]